MNLTMGCHGIIIRNYEKIKIYQVYNIVLFKSLRNSKRRNKGNVTLKSNSNKIKLCGGGGQHYLVFNVIISFICILTISKWIKQYFPRKMLKKICFSCQINLTSIGERLNKKNIESLNLTWKVNLLRLWHGNYILMGFKDMGTRKGKQKPIYSWFECLIKLQKFILVILRQLLRQSYDNQKT